MRSEIALINGKPTVIQGMKTVPYGFPEMGWAWLACVIAVSEQPGATEQFQKDTGYSLKSILNQSPIAKMIDQATGHEATVLAAWCDWVTEKVWGTE